MLPTCMVIGCANSTHNQHVKYYRVPVHNQVICKQWYINTLREDLHAHCDHYVCVEHFDEESFYPNNQQLLKDDAVPSLFEIEVFQKMINHQEIVNTQRVNAQMQQQKQPLLTNLILSQAANVAGQQQTAILNRCSVKNCSNSLDNSKTELYSLPKTEDIAKKWKIMSNVFDENLRLCRDHFQNSDFNEFNYLKPDAIPTQFPHKTAHHRADTNVSGKAMKRTSSAATSHQSASKIQKAVKHTNPIMSNRNYLSAALNVQQSQQQQSPTATPTGRTAKALKQAANVTNNNLLKDILPPPIMQSTKRAAKAVKHTGGGSFGYYNSGLVAAATAAAAQTQQSPVHAVQMSQNVDLLTQKLNQFVAQKTPLAEPQPHKVTYIYKRVNQPHEIDLYLECEDDDEVVVVMEPEVVVPQQQTPQPMRKRPIQEQKQLYKPIASVQPLEKPKMMNDYHLNGRHGKQAPRLKEEKRHMQMLMKFYSRQPAVKRDSANAAQKGQFKGKCSICDIVLDNNIELTSHICSHLEGVNYISPFDAVTTTCSVCDLSFLNPFDLIKHLDDEHMKQLNEYKCRICEKQHTNLNDLNRHLSESHVPGEMPYNCEVCGFRTSFYADAIYHIKKEHSNTLYHFCPYCLKALQLPYGDKVQHTIVTNFYNHLITHFNKHENNELIESKCKHCRKCILHVRYMKEHLANDHKTNQQMKLY